MQIPTTNPETVVSQQMSSQQPPLSQVEHMRTIVHHLRIAADQVSDGILILEPGPVEAPGPRIVYVNKALCRLTGRKMEELLGHSLGLLYEPDKLVNILTRLPAVAEDGRLFHTIAGLNRADGSCAAVRWTVRAVNDRYGRTLNYTITVREEVAAPEAAWAMAPGAAVARRDPVADSSGSSCEMIDKCRMESLAIVAGGMAHDFNNLLQTMMGRFDLIRPELEGNPQLLEHFSEVESAARSARGLTSHLLAFAKGGDREHKLADLCDIICKSKTLACIGSSVDCEMEFDEDVRPALVDETQITQVVSNLIINARQAMNNTGIIRVRAENTRVTANARLDVPEGDYVRISVEDRGCGIPQENLDNIFNAFFTTKKEGTGLGLAVTRAIVRSHGGDITVRSQVNVGTEFEVYLPAKEWPDEAPVEIPRGTRSSSGFNPASGNRSRGNVLVIDDIDGVRNVACALIRSLGFEANSAASGEEGVRLYRDAMLEHDPYAVVLLDMTLPGGISGDETMQELRRMDPEARIIASSGALERDMPVQFSSCGYTGVLPKPYSSQELKEALCDAIHASPV